MRKKRNFYIEPEDYEALKALGGGNASRGIRVALGHQSGPLPVRLSHPRTKLPARKHAADAGMDIYAVEPATLKPGVHAVLPTGVHTEIPHGHVGLVWPRSGMAAKHGVDVLAGVVDSGYSGEVMVSLINLGHEDVEIKPGDRIAQMLIQRVELWSCVEVDELGESERGVNGLGSSGR